MVDLFHGKTVPNAKKRQQLAVLTVVSLRKNVSYAGYSTQDVEKGETLRKITPSARRKHHQERVLSLPSWYAFKNKP